MPIITPPNYLVAPVTLPATTADPLTTEGGNTLDNGSGGFIPVEWTNPSTDSFGPITASLRNITGQSGFLFTQPTSLPVDYIAQGGVASRGYIRCEVRSGYSLNNSGALPEFQIGPAGTLSPVGIAVSTAGLWVTSSGTNTSLVATATSPTITSGTAFTPSTTVDTMVYVQIDGASAGSYTVTMGPSTGAEHTLYSAAAVVAGNDPALSFRVPGGWKVVVTVTTVTIASCLVVTC